MLKDAAQFTLDSAAQSAKKDRRVSNICAATRRSMTQKRQVRISLAHRFQRQAAGKVFASIGKNHQSEAAVHFRTDEPYAWQATNQIAKQTGETTVESTPDNDAVGDAKHHGNMQQLESFCMPRIAIGVVPFIV